MSLEEYGEDPCVRCAKAEALLHAQEKLIENLREGIQKMKEIQQLSEAECSALRDVITAQRAEIELSEEYTRRCKAWIDGADDD